jgi:hypothetical protein
MNGMNRLTGTLLLLCASGCLRMYAPKTPAYTRADLQEVAARLHAGKPAGDFFVEGPAIGTLHSIQVEAGTCYDLGVATDPAIHTQIAATLVDALHYPTGAAGIGEVDPTQTKPSTATLSFCADHDTEVKLTLQTSRPYQLGMSQLETQAKPTRFAGAMWTRRESTRARTERLARERREYRRAERRTCEERSRLVVEVLDCLREVDDELERRDALVLESEGEQPSASR